MRPWHGLAGSAGSLHARPPARDARAGGRGTRRLLLALTLAGALLAASACEVGVGVDIDVAENGSGTVEVGVSLDRAAADALGDLATQLDLADLALAGWDVTGPAREADNLLWVRASKRFGSAEELPSILAEIAGPEVFGGFQLRRRAEFAEQTWEVAGRVDPAAALPELFDTLAFNEGLGQRLQGAVGDYGGDIPLEGLTLRLNIDLPGQLTSGGGAFTWTSPVEDPPTEPVTVRMTAREENTTAKTLRLVGLAAAALFVLAMLLNVLGWWYIRRFRKRRARVLMAKADSEQIPAVVTGDMGAGDPLDPVGAGGDLRAPPERAAGTAAVGDDVDWDDLAGAEFEDLSGDFEDLAGDFDDLAGDFESLPDDLEDLPHDFESLPDDFEDEGPAPTATGDWTASLEESPTSGHETDAVATTAEEPEPEALAEAEPEEPEEVAEPEEPDGPSPVGEPDADEAPGEGATEIIEALPLALGPEEGDDEPESDEPDDDEPETDEPETDEPETDEPETDEPETDEPDDDDEPESDSEPVAPAPTPASRALRLVVIGGWGVLFQPADPVGELLIPFVRQAGATASPAEIRESYRLATLGRLTPEQLWESCGLTGTPTWTHGPYTGRMSVSAGAAEFARSLLRRRIRVACVTNDVSEWSWRLRAWTGFEALSPWVVSSDIGIRKPDPGVFEMLRRVSEIPFANCLVIDNDVRTLDAARSLGMSTGLFGTRGAETPATGITHPAVGDFSDLLRRT